MRKVIGHSRWSKRQQRPGKACHAPIRTRTPVTHPGHEASATTRGPFVHYHVSCPAFNFGGIPGRTHDIPLRNLRPRRDPRVLRCSLSSARRAATAATAGAQQGAQQGQQPRRPRPYAQVITDNAVTDAGGITVHRVDDRWFFEVPDSLVRRDFLLVTRVAGVPSNFGGFTSAGTSIAERVVRWERNGDRVLLRTIGFDAYADDSLPIAISVASNNVGAILAAFPIQAFTRDSATLRLDVTDFFGGDTPALSGLTPRSGGSIRCAGSTRRAASSTPSARFPLNVEVRHTQTFDAAEPPSDRERGHDLARDAAVDRAASERADAAALCRRRDRLLHASSA